MIRFMSVTTPGVLVSQEFPKPGRGIKRIIVEVDPPEGGSANFRITPFPGVSIEDSGVRLVFDVV